MKTSNLLFVLCLILFAAGSFATETKISGNNTETQTRTAESFHAIKVSTGIDLYINQGDVEKIIVEADDDIIDDLKTVVKDGVLKIYMEKKFNWSWNWNVTRKVYVTVRDLDELHASSGSDVESKGAIQVKDLRIDANSGSDVELELRAEKIYVSTSSGSDAELKGTTEYLEASSSSGSDLDAAELKSKVCKVSASSGADATVYASESIKANASSGGDIRYSGNPSAKDIDESSGGDVYKR